MHAPSTMHSIWGYMIWVVYGCSDACRPCIQPMPVLSSRDRVQVDSEQMLQE